MPRVRPLTSVEREMQADEAAVERASREFLELLCTERGRRDMKYMDMAELIGVCPDTLKRWRNGCLGKASLESLVKVGRKLGFRVQFVPEEGGKHGQAFT